MTDFSKSKYVLSFYFDYGCESCLWAQNDAAVKKYDLTPIDETQYDQNENIKRLPKITLPDFLKTEISLLSKMFDSSLNWNSPSEPELTWTIEKQNEFEGRARKLYRDVCNYLGEDYDVIYNQK